MYLEQIVGHGFWNNFNDITFGELLQFLSDPNMI